VEETELDDVVKGGFDGVEGGETDEEEGEESRVGFTGVEDGEDEGFVKEFEEFAIEEQCGTQTEQETYGLVCELVPGML
jgi:hypothetical protein